MILLFSYHVQKNLNHFPPFFPPPSFPHLEILTLLFSTFLDSGHRGYILILFFFFFLHLTIALCNIEAPRGIILVLFSLLVLYMVIQLGFVVYIIW